MLATSTLGCGDDPLAGGDAPTDSNESPVTEARITIEAPLAVANLWQGWNQKYVLFAHRTAGIKTFADIEGKRIDCAYINTDQEPWVCENIVRDMQKLQETGGITKKVGIQNNDKVYKAHLLENKDVIGCLSAGLAAHYKLADEPDLVELVFVTDPNDTGLASDEDQDEDQAASAVGNGTEDAGAKSVAEDVRAEPCRTWTDSTGNHTIEAEFLRIDDGVVWLKKADGLTKGVPLEKLSEEDQAFATSQGREEIWRTSLADFAKEVFAVAEKSEIVNARVANTRIRSKLVLTANGKEVWVAFKHGFGNEFHGQLANQFTGQVEWHGIVTSVETDEKENVQLIDVNFPSPTDAPHGIEFRDILSLSIPISKLPSENVPVKGAEFAFRGTLEKEDDDAPLEPVWVLYGLGPNVGKIRIGVNLIDIEPL